MSRDLRRGCAAFVGGTLAIAFAGSAALGATIGLSDLSSDSTPASVLLATMEFEVSGSTLTVTVTNDTASPNDYKMNEVYFNAPASLTGLTLTSPPSGWNLHTNVAADGFGVFSFGLIDGVGTSPAMIQPGATTVFTFMMTGTASETDFVSIFSSIPPGSQPAIVAAKFVGGPGDDSAYGATIPAPGAAAVVAVGAGLMLRRRRRG